MARRQAEAGAGLRSLVPVSGASVCALSYHCDSVAFRRDGGVAPGCGGSPPLPRRRPTGDSGPAPPLHRAICPSPPWIPPLSLSLFTSPEGPIVLRGAQGRTGGKGQVLRTEGGGGLGRDPGCDRVLRISGRPCLFDCQVLTRPGSCTVRFIVFARHFVTS